MATLQDYYDRYWAEGGFQPPRNDNGFIEAQLAVRCSAGKRVADLGCGDAGTIGDRAVAAGARYTGLDLSPSAVSSAKGRGLDVRLVDDVGRTGLPDDEFDAVFVIEVLEHLVDPLSAVAEAHRILRGGGAMVVTVPNAAVWPRRIELMFKGRPNAMGDDLSRSKPWRDPHLRSFTVSTLRALIDEAGFSSIDVGGTEPMSPVRVGEALTRFRPTLFARRCTAVALK